MLASLILANALTLAILLGMIGGGLWMVADVLIDMERDARRETIRHRRGARRNALARASSDAWHAFTIARRIGNADMRGDAFAAYETARRALARYDAQTARACRSITGAAY